MPYILGEALNQPLKVWGIGNPRLGRRTSFINRRQTYGHNLMDGLLSYFPLTSIDAIDVVATKNCGVGVGSSGTAVSSQTGSNALSFNGSGYYERSDDHFRAGSAGFSIVAWFVNTGTNDRAIVSRYESGLPRSYLLFDNGGSLQFWTSANGTAFNSVAWGAYSANVLHMVHAFIKADGTQGISLDGAAPVTNGTGLQPIDGTITFRIAAYGETGPNSKWVGTISRVGLWKGRTLSTDEVSWLYNSGMGRSYPFV